MTDDPIAQRLVPHLSRARACTVLQEPLRVEIDIGPVMYPSLVTEDTRVVRLLKSACVAMLSEEPESFYGQSAHDQGYLNFVGIPTANFGSGEQAYAHTDMDMGSVDKIFDAAKVYTWIIAAHVGAGTDQNQEI